MIKLSELPEGSFVAVSFKYGDEIVSKDDVKVYVKENKDRILTAIYYHRNMPAVFATEERILTFDENDISEWCDKYDEQGYDDMSQDVFNSLTFEERNQICEIMNNALRRTPVYFSIDKLVDIDN